MSTTEMQLQMKTQRRAMRAKLKEQRVAQKLALAKNPLFVAAAAKRLEQKRRRQAVALWAILLLLLLRFDCEGEPLPQAAPVVAAVVVPVKKPPPKKKKRKLAGKIKKAKRPDLDVKPPAPPSWLAQFRLQVAARGPRLATCLNGIDQPGALRWSALVHARSGRVYEAVVEPVFRGDALTQSQLDCLVDRLKEQRYRLDEPDPKAVARRVSLIFEF